MTPIVVTCGDIPQELLDLFKAMRKFIEELPDFEGEVLTCHALCAALAQLHPSLRPVDGSFGGMFEHSWLIDDRYPKALMDMYPVAGAVPYIISTSHSFLPWARLYVEKPSNYNKDVFNRQVQKILAHAYNQSTCV